MENKKYLSIDEQIVLLKSKKLLFKSEKKAKEILNRIGYYKLINAYKIPFMKYEDETHVYMDNIYFEDIYNLYMFDRELKAIVFESSTSIEINFKACISDVISNKYGIKEKDYLKKENFSLDTGVENEYTFRNMQTHINNEIKKQLDNEQPAIKWYDEQYGYFPFWVVVNILTIGSISRIYGKMKEEDQIIVAKNYKLPKEYISAYIKHINLIRNICAHNDVLYRYKSINSIPQKIKNVKEKYIDLGIQINHKTGRFNIGTNDFLASIIIFKLMLSKEDYNNFKTRLKGALHKLEKKLSSENYDIVLNEMGLINEGERLKLDLLDKKIEKVKS